VPTGAAAKSNDDFGPGKPATIAGHYGREHPGPFAWQDGRRLWILDGRGTDWILAELLFDPRSCRYLEVRRARYQWPREAAGALLGRTFVGGPRRAEEAARGLAAWVMRSESLR
jgi:hypothetical protein